MTSLSHLLIRVSACAALGGVLGACSAALDFTECRSNEDCASFFDDNKPMHCVDSVCQVRDDGCTSHSQCAGLGPSFICTATNECASTESEQCGAPIWPGGEMTDKVVLVGVMVPKDGPDRELGLAMEKAALAAVNEFNAAGELQSGKKIAPVVCDTKGNKSTAIAAARHLGDKLTVPVFIGPVDDTEFVAVADNVTFAPGVLAFSMGPMLTAKLAKHDSGKLLFSAMAGPAYQGMAIRRRIAADFDADVMATSIMLVSADVYGQGGLYTFVAPGSETEANEIKEVPGKQTMASYAGIDSAKKKLDEHLQKDVPEPTMLVLLGRAEVAEIIAYYLSLVDAGSRPMPQKIYVPHRAMPAIAALKEPALAGVVVAVAPELDTPLLSALRSRVGETSLPGEAMLAYDATMASLLAMATVDPKGAVVGPTVATGIASLVGGEEAPLVDFASGPKQFIPTALTALMEGQTINIKGFSGPLDFDASGEVCGTIAAYTLDAEGSGWVKTAVYTPMCPNAEAGTWADVP